jgi:hypothetical protein
MTRFVGDISKRNLGKRIYSAPDHCVKNEPNALAIVLRFELSRSEHNADLKPSGRSPRFQVRLLHGDPRHTGFFQSVVYDVVLIAVPRPSSNVFKEDNPEQTGFGVGYHFEQRLTL